MLAPTERPTLRFLRILTCFGLFWAAGCAVARGGPGGVFADVFVEISRIAVTFGAVLGVVHGLARRMSRLWLLLPLLGGSLLAVLWPFLGLVLFTIGGVGSVTAAVLSDVARRGLVDSLAAEARDTRSWLSICLAASQRPFAWVAITYVFWLLLSLPSSSVLGFLIFAPLFWQLTSGIGDYLPFLLPPLFVALSAASIGTALFFRRWKGIGEGGYMAPILFNIVFAATFLIAGDIYRAKLMEIELRGRKPINYQSVSFVATLIAPRSYFREPHASFSEGGKSYFWSYRKRCFVTW